MSSSPSRRESHSRPHRAGLEDLLSPSLPPECLDRLWTQAWEWGGVDEKPILHKENLTYEFVEMKQRSYK